MLMSMILTAALIAADEPLVTGSVTLIGEGFTFTEGPLWLPEGRWVFSDVPEDKIHYEDGTLYRHPSNNANGLALDPQGRLLACEPGRITRTEKDGSTTVLADSYEGKALNSTNDLTVRSDGTVFFTDPKPLRGGDETELGFAGVYARAPDGEVKLLSDDFTYPNGIALSPDESTLYVSDTTKGHIRAFDLATDASVSAGRIHCEVRIPDGIAVDAAGRIWSSSSRGIVVFSTRGDALGSVNFRGMPTNCAFGGPDGKTLFITARKVVYTVECNIPQP